MPDLTTGLDAWITTTDAKVHELEQRVLKLEAGTPSPGPGPGPSPVDTIDTTEELVARAAEPGTWYVTPKVFALDRRLNVVAGSRLLCARDGDPTAYWGMDVRPREGQPSDDAIMCAGLVEGVRIQLPPGSISGVQLVGDGVCRDVTMIGGGGSHLRRFELGPNQALAEGVVVMNATSGYLTYTRDLVIRGLVGVGQGPVTSGRYAVHGYGSRDITQTFLRVEGLVCDWIYHSIIGAAYRTAFIEGDLYLSPGAGTNDQAVALGYDYPRSATNPARPCGVAEAKLRVGGACKYATATLARHDSLTVEYWPEQPQIGPCVPGTEAGGRYTNRGVIGAQAFVHPWGDGRAFIAQWGGAPYPADWRELRVFREDPPLRVSDAIAD